VKLEYHGPHDGVDVPLPDGRELLAEPGKPVDLDGVDEAFVSGLLVQETNWKPADAAAKKLAAKLRDEPAADAESAEQPAAEVEA
jgi:endonuclease III-like uncharacterized protein